MQLRVLTWNLFHGRRNAMYGGDAGEAFDAFTDALRRWQWDVALLQEVPPWWPAAFATTLGVEQRHVLTSRNGGLVIRRWLAERWPDVMRSHGGGSNALLVRGVEIAAARKLRLCRLPERRWLQGIRVVDRRGDAVWIGNVHLSGRARAAAREAARAGEAVREWAAGEAVLLGGDFNLTWPLVRGFTYAGGHYVDHLLVSGLRAAGRLELPLRAGLSDHPAVIVTVGE